MLKDGAGRPVFGQPVRYGVPELAHRADLPIVQLCRDPRQVAPTGDPCYRCLANHAAPGELVACHFLRKEGYRP